MLNNLFEHTDVQLPDDCTVKISPSQIDKFFNMPAIWYKENILKEEQSGGYYGDDTGRLLGTILHKIYECVSNKESITREDINSTLEAYLVDNPLVVANVNDIENLYPLMSEVAVNTYLLKSKCTNIETEVQMYTKLGEGIYLAGTSDRIEDSDIIVDYKNETSKPSNLVTIPFKYKIQMLAYAYLLYKRNGTKPTRLRVVYIIRPTKTLPARCFVVTETIQDSDWKLIEDSLNLITESILAIKENPALTHLIFKSMEFKVGN